jgi:hypothetical protein
LDNDGGQFARNSAARDRSVCDRVEAFLGDVVDDVQDAEAAAIGELVMDRATRCATGSSMVARVDRPARIWPGFDQDGRACADCLAPRPPLAHSQAFLAIEPVDVVDARGLTLAPQQDEQPPIAEPASLVG